jgi:hypothetical protein
MVRRSRVPVAVMSDQRICVNVNRRALSGATLLSGVLTCLGIVGIVLGQQVAAKVIVIAMFGPVFAVSLNMMLRRRPVLVLEPDRLVDVRRHKSLRWEAITEARLSESKGLLGRAYHELVLSGAADGRVNLGSIDMLSRPWGEIATLVEERLPASVQLRRESAPTRKRRRPYSSGNP